MKALRQSRYVVQTQSKEGWGLLYNVANGAFAQLGKKALKTWQGKAEDAACLQQLADAGFLTALSAEEELACQQQAFSRQRADTSELVLSLIPTYACNHRCPYCYEKEEVNIPGKMDQSLIDAIMDFVATMHKRNRFTKLSVQWYGGDPSLALDVVETATQQLFAWCEEQGVTYDANMLSNCMAMDEDKVALLQKCHISLMLVTIDGPEDVHNQRRVATGGRNSFAHTMQGAKMLVDAGIPVLANMNVDKANGPLYEQTRQMVQDLLGVPLTMGKLNDYLHVFGEGTFCGPTFDLFSHEEFFQYKLDAFKKQDHDADAMRAMLRPVGRFCTGQMDNYFIIDCFGDVYNCDGWAGKKDHIRFNLFDDEQTWKLHEVTFNATQDEKCKECEMLPLCLGSCIWERSCCGMPCFPLKSTIDEYLQIYRDCIDMDCDEVGVTLLAEPFSAQELGWEGDTQAIPNFTERHNVIALKEERAQG